MPGNGGNRTEGEGVTEGIGWFYIPLSLCYLDTRSIANGSVSHES